MLAWGWRGERDQEQRVVGDWKEDGACISFSWWCLMIGIVSLVKTCERQGVVFHHPLVFGYLLSSYTTTSHSKTGVTFNGR